MAWWSTSDLEKDGQTAWLVRLFEKTMLGMRQHGLPSERIDGVINVKVPTLAAQAKTMRHRDILPPGHNTPTGVLG